MNYPFMDFVCVLIVDLIQWILGRFKEEKLTEIIHLLFKMDILTKKYWRGTGNNVINYMI